MSNAKLERRKARSRLNAEARNAERAAQLLLVKARLVGVLRRGTVSVPISGTRYYVDGSTARFGVDLAADRLRQSSRRV